MGNHHPNSRPIDRVGENLFRLLQQKIEVLVAIADECNDLSEALGALGYGDDPNDPTPPKESDLEPMPYFEVCANIRGWMTVENGDFLQEFLDAGLRKPKRARPKRDVMAAVADSSDPIQPA